MTARFFLCLRRKARGHRPRLQWSKWALLGKLSHYRHLTLLEDLGFSVVYLQAPKKGGFCMPRQSAIVLTLTILIVLGVACSVFAQQPPQGQRGAAPARVTRPPLFFKEEWKQTPAGGEHPVNPAEALANPNLELRLYGASSKEIQLTGAATDENNPIHLWSGLCTTPCAVALRHKEN